MHDGDHTMEPKEDQREASKQVEPSAKKQLEGSIGKIDELVLMMLAMKEMMPQIAPQPAGGAPMPGQPSPLPLGAGAPPMPAGPMGPQPPMGGGGMMPAMQLQQAMQGARGLM